MLIQWGNNFSPTWKGMKMKKNLIALALLAAMTAPAFAETAPEPAAEKPASPHTLTGNLSLVSDYRFRGIDQTFGKPALQGGFDYAHSSGFYAGNWNSNVNSGAGFPEANLEMDFYGGYKTSFGDFSIDVGAIYYYYPGSDAAPLGASGTVDNKEVYLGVSWKFLSLKYSHAIDEYFDVPNTKNSGYWDLSASQAFGDGWGVNAHVGRMKVKGVSNADYTDWKLGVTKDIAGYVLGLSYIGTNAKGNSGEFYSFGNDLPGATKTKDAGRDIVVVSLSKTF